MRRRKVIGYGILGLAVALGLGWLARLDFSEKISTDVLDLIPKAERSPELAIARSLAGEAEARVMLFVLSRDDGEAVPAEAGERFAAALAASPAFAEAVALSDRSVREALAREIHARRLPLLFPGWLAERRKEFAAAKPGVEFEAWLVRRSAQDLESFLVTPEALGFQDLLGDDPLLLLPRVASRMPGGFAGGATDGLVWARITASPMEEAGQGPVFAAVERALEQLRADYPGLHLEYTGVNRFAAASRKRIVGEVKWLNSASLAAVLAVAVIFLRGVHRALHLAPVVLMAVLGAWVGGTLCFERLHVLVFVVGSLLTGVAIDYGFYLYMQPATHPDEEYWSKVRRLAKPLLASCLTTVAGFALLLFSDLPVIRQLGVFVGVGLVTALVAAVVYFSTVSVPFLEARAFLGGRVLPAGMRRRLRLAMIGAWTLALPGIARLQWRDDIHELEVPARNLLAIDAAVRAKFGGGESRQLYLSYGENLASARDALARFKEWREGQRKGTKGPRDEGTKGLEVGDQRRGTRDQGLGIRDQGPGSSARTGIAAVVPTVGEYAEAVQFAREHPDFGSELARELGEQGFEADAFDDFARAFRTYASAEVPGWEAEVRSFAEQLKGPLGMLIHAVEKGPKDDWTNGRGDDRSTGPTGRTSTDRSSGSSKSLSPLVPLSFSPSSSPSWFVTIGADVKGVVPAELHTVSADQLQSLNEVFGRYRRSALRLSMVGLAIVGIGVLLTYGLRDGLRIFAIPCGVCLGVFGIFGWCGQPLNLFHLLGAFLGVCLTHNYSIFTATSAYAHEPPPVSVRLSALTTAASFGVLACSGIPVVRALGLTVMLMVFAALLVIEFEHLSALSRSSKPGTTDAHR